MPFSPPLRPGESVDNRRLAKIFRCSPQGGMRRSLATNSLVLICDHTQSIYRNRWGNEIFHYMGIGLFGDQDLAHGPNRTLAGIPANGVSAFLFERYEKGAYTYIGEVEPAGPPYQETQKDRKGRLRKVWVFPLQLRGGGSPPPVPAAAVEEKRKAGERMAARLSLETLTGRVKETDGIRGTHRVSSQVAEYDPYVAEYVRRRARGFCELCKKSAPFLDPKGIPFLEMHHIVPLSAGGEDTIENTVALCPNCHRKMHVVPFPIDIAVLKMVDKNIPITPAGSAPATTARGRVRRWSR